MTGDAQPYGGWPFSGSYLYYEIEPEDVLVRVYNSSDARKNGYTGTTWNPRVPPRGATSRDAGRFDPLTSCGGFLYGSTSGNGDQVALVEVFRPLMARDPATGENQIMRRERNSRSLVRFRARTSLSLISINGPAAREAFHMDEEVLYDGRRDVTRDWAAAIKKLASKMDFAAGIAYNSTQDTVSLGQVSFILWADCVSQKIFDVSEEIELSSDEGRELLRVALAPYRPGWR